MANMHITYKVVGRYMNGKEVDGYHFIGSDNSSLALNKERTIYFIGKGLIENMRISANNGEVLIRGKGVNLNNLPVYDESKQKYRPGAISQNAANSSARAREIDSRNNMSKFKIVKRIMQGTSCVGYVLEDVSGNIRNVSRDTVLECARTNRLSNAVVNKVTDPKTGALTYALRGVNGCQIKRLPILIIDQSGRIVDPTKSVSGVVIRATRMKHGGIVTHVNGSSQTFGVGDFLMVNPSGQIRIVPGTEFIQNYTPESSLTTATCDHCLECVSDYTVEIYGSNAIVLNPSFVLTWNVAKHK